MYAGLSFRGRMEAITGLVKKRISVEVNKKFDDQNLHSKIVNSSAPFHPNVSIMKLWIVSLLCM